MAKVTFRSGIYRRYRAYFGPELYGTIDTAEFWTDRAGNAIIEAETGKPMRKKAPIPAAQFDNHMLVLDDEDPIQKQQIRALREFIANGRKAGRLSDAELYEEEPWMTQQIEAGAGNIVVTVPESLDDEDRALLFGSEETGPGLMTFFHNAIPKPAINKAMALLDAGLARYEVQGIYSPTPERAEKLVRGRIQELVFALKDAGLDLETESRKAHSEAMKGGNGAEGTGGQEAQEVAAG